MSLGSLAFSKYAEGVLLTIFGYTGNSIPSSAYGFLNHVYRLQAPPVNTGPGVRVFRVRLATACNPRNIHNPRDYTELSGGGYPATPPHVVFERVTGASHTFENKFPVSFGTPTAAWQDISHAIVTVSIPSDPHGLWGENVNGKNIILWHKFEPAFTANVGDPVVFPAGAFKVTMT